MALAIPLSLLLLLNASDAPSKWKAQDTPLTENRARLYGHYPEARPDEPLRLGPGPHLFLDDYLVAESRNLDRVVESPRRDPSLPNPVVTGEEDGCFQPYMSVRRDPDSGRFRLWYNHRTEDRDEMASRIGYMESDDGIRWERPTRVLDNPGPIQFGLSIVDEGPMCSDPQSRFILAWWHDGGLKAAASPDGFDFTALDADPVIYHNHDINGLFYDPLRKHYTAVMSITRTDPSWSGRRRLTLQSTSADLRNWSRPHFILLPDYSVDEGELQFYAMDGFLTRGDLVIGMVKVLRDDLKADNPPDPPDAYGMGYTALAWTRDGVTWTRDPAHYFDPDPRPGTWDHAHAWIDEQTPVGDEVYLYYAGYAHGHKVNRFQERQIGLLRIPRDRYVARAAGDEEGQLVTPLLRLEGGDLTVNVDAEGGSLTVHLVDAEGRPITGFAPGDIEPLTADALDAPVVGKRPLTELEGQPVRLVFTLRNARLYGFSL